MNYRNLLTVLLLTAALMLNACNKTEDSEKTDNRSTDTPVITETDPPAPIVPDGTEELPVQQPEDTTAAVTETEPVPETTAPIPELPTESAAEETTAAPSAEETEPAEPAAPAPIVIAKPVIDISDSLVPGGTPITGQIASAESEHIRLLLDYTVEQQEDGNVMLTLDVGLSCYELWCSAKNDMGTITVNGVSHTFSTDAIDHMVNEKTYIPFLTQTYNSTGGEATAVEVSWKFNGNYGGKDVGVLTAGMTLRYGANDTAVPEIPGTEAVTEPVNPVDPTVPTEPAAPDIPSETTASEQPADPVTTEPVTAEPTDTPTEPVPPVDATEPAEPETTAAPEVSAETASPGEPTEDTTPTPPTEQEPTETETVIDPAPSEDAAEH